MVAVAAAAEVDRRSPDAVTAAVEEVGAAVEAAVAAADICCQVGLAAVAVVAAAGLPRILPAERAWSATCGNCSMPSG